MDPGCSRASAALVDTFVQPTRRPARWRDAVRCAASATVHLRPSRERSWQRRLVDTGDGLSPARRASAVVSLMSGSLFRFVCAAIALVGSAGPAASAPYTPSSDDQVVERLALRAGDRAARELAALRAQWRRDPARRRRRGAIGRGVLDRAGAEGRPALHRLCAGGAAALVERGRSAGRGARAARRVCCSSTTASTRRWPTSTPRLQAEPDNAEAWAWLHRDPPGAADYAQAARAAASGWPPLTPRADRRGLHGAGRRRSPAARPRGRERCARRCSRRRRRARRAAVGADPAGRDRRAPRRASAAAEARLPRRAGAAAARRLPAGRLCRLPARPRPRRRGAGAAEGPARRADVLLLRLALAAKAAQRPGAARWARELGARFDAARPRGDTSHRKEESRFALALQRRRRARAGAGAQQLRSSSANRPMRASCSRPRWRRASPRRPSRCCDWMAAQPASRAWRCTALARPARGRCA